MLALIDYIYLRLHLLHAAHATGLVIYSVDLAY